MKRIINGATYNTDASVRLARSEWEDDGQVTGTLYQTRGGAFFVVEEFTNKQWCEGEGRYTSEPKYHFQTLSREDANEWLLEGEVEIFHNPFEDMPEAAADDHDGATLYVRVPASLKRSADEAAREVKVSTNAWAMRCIERCLDKDLSHELIDVWAIAAELSSCWSDQDGIDPNYKAHTATQALSHIKKLIQWHAKNQHGTDDISKLGGEGATSRFRPYPE
jgi:predicted HicB family RNase H-like nuclease